MSADVITLALASLALGMFVLLWIALRLGASAARIEATQAHLDRKLSALDMVPGLVVRVGIVEAYTARNTKNIATLLMVAKEEAAE